MKAIVCAYHNIGCAGINAVLHCGFEVLAVFTHLDRADEDVWFDSVAELAASRDIPVYAPDDLNHPLWVKRIAELSPDILFSFYYRRMIKKPILNIPPVGCLNLHGSLLPAYRGRCPINWVLVNGEKETGVTLHYMTPRPDDGDIVCQKKIAISPDDTAFTLNAKAVEASSTMLAEYLPRIVSGTAERRPQEHSHASYFGGRRPDDGEIDWRQNAAAIRNLVRAVTRPYPGAFSYRGDLKCLFWSVSVVHRDCLGVAPGTVISTSPLIVSCAEGALQVDYAQTENGIYVTGCQLAGDLNLAPGMVFGKNATRRLDLVRKKTVLILGVNGFIGSALAERLLADGSYVVHGMDLYSNYITHLKGRNNFFFNEGDISIHREWIEYHVRKCDIVIPLIAIATPIEYVRNPIGVFELDFEENLRVIRYCVKYNKRIIFPSTSEVYGMSPDDDFDEDSTFLTLGPIRMQRWIYSCIKQLLDRVIWAYGQKEGLQFTLFRPFNWIGPRLDSLQSARIGSSRAITQLIVNLVDGTPIQLIDGGNQKRCFTDVEDGVECLFRIIENNDGVCDGEIINIGNPDNEFSIKELANLLVETFDQHPLRAKFPRFAGMKEVESSMYYGAGYQDIQHRRPSIRNARRLLDWKPTQPMAHSVKVTLDFFLRNPVESSFPNALEVEAVDCDIARRA